LHPEQEAEGLEKRLTEAQKELELEQVPLQPYRKRVSI